MPLYFLVIILKKSLQASSTVFFQQTVKLNELQISPTGIDR
jgi:hypothetical protein